MLLGLVRPTAGTGTVLGAPIDRPGRLPAAGRRADREPGVLPGADRPPRTCGCSPPSAAMPTPRIPALLDLVGLADRGDDRYRSYSLGHEAASRHRRGAARRPGAAHPRRAGQRPRPAGRARDARPDRLAGPQRPHGARVVARPQRARAGVRLAGADRGRPIAVPGPDASTSSGHAAPASPSRPSTRRTSTSLAARAAPRPVTRVERARRTARRRRRDRTVDDLAAAVNRAAHDAGIVLVELSPLRTSLEDRYLALVDADARRRSPS